MTSPNPIYFDEQSSRRIASAVRTIEGRSLPYNAIPNKTASQSQAVDYIAEVISYDNEIAVCDLYNFSNLETVAIPNAEVIYYNTSGVAPVITLGTRFEVRRVGNQYFMKGFAVI